MVRSRHDAHFMGDTPLTHQRALPIYPNIPEANESRLPGHVTGALSSNTQVTDYGQNLLYRSTRQIDDVNEVRQSIELDLNNLNEFGDWQDHNTMDPKVDQIDVDDDVTIKQQLFSARLPEQGNTREGWFIPRKQLDTICTFDAVYNEVYPLVNNVKEAASCAEFVCGPKGRPSSNHLPSARKIFAILILIDHVRLIFQFQKVGIKDEHLPFRANPLKTALWSSHGAKDLQLDFFKHAKDSWAISNFYDRQWFVHIPYIARDSERGKACDYQLHPKTVMPWTDFPEHAETGGFGEVRRIQIHPDHHGFSGNYQAFALKTFHRNSDFTREDFQREIKAFRKMEAVTHEVTHLVELCATFESEDEYRLLFPWADGGSLKKLWTSHPTSLFPHQSAVDPPSIMQWLAKQAYGLMCGLKMIHELPEPGRAEVLDGRLYGIHGDLKPENILHFSQETKIYPFGTLKIADFGILEFRSLATRTSPNKEWMGPASPTYRSPEHNLEIEQMMSRKVDIWSMGCVFSEMLTWALCGGVAVDAFRDRRAQEPTRVGDPESWKEDNFFCRTIGSRGGDDEGANDLYNVHNVKPSVLEWLSDLQSQASGAPSDGHDETTFCEAFVAFIRDKMLAPIREQRASCEEVIEFFEPSLKRLDHTPYWACNWQEDQPSTPFDDNYSPVVRFQEPREIS